MENNFLGLLLSVLVFISGDVNGCTIEGIDSWLVAETQTIFDIFRGNIWDRSTSDIEAITGVAHIEGLNNGPYVTISLVNSRLIIATNDAFENYEEYETSTSMGFTITFRCSDGISRPFVFQVAITDTNNNDPQFRPTDTYEFTIALPIPPGFLITNNIIVRDIDLTTERIDFEVAGSSLFQIAYDDSSTVPKEFKAALRTTTLIRSIPEPVILTLTATDVDTTGDARRTATATVNITADSEFIFPDEPIFSQTFYLATYTTEHKLILDNSISLREGFDDQVIFSFEGQHSQYFDIVINENDISFTMKLEIPVSLYREGQILLVVKAERNYTSGATATVIVQLPEAIDLAFDAGVYEGSIEDNKLNLVDLQLKQGYEDTTITVDITSDYQSYFSSSVVESTITLSMDPLSDSIIKENNFINLQVAATTASNSTGTTIVNLEIIKDDITTPVFERNLYTGSYNQETGLTLEKIVLIQGYDSTVVTTLEGEHSSLFEKTQDESIISLSIPSLPSELLAERSILVSVRATKPRTVGANAVVQITLPTGLSHVIQYGSDSVVKCSRELSFEKFIYKGNLEDNIITLETIVLSVGYSSDVIFNLTGDHADYFNINFTENEGTLSAKESLPENVLENSFLVFVLSASGTNAATTSATIILEIIKQDTVTPVFSKYIYQGTYTNNTHIDFEAITLIQGYDDTVTFNLDGIHAQYFSISSETESGVILTQKTTIPESLIFDEKVLLFNVRAEKPRTVGGNAAISLRFPQDLTEPAILRFSQNTYSGLLDDGILTMDNIVLESSFTTDTTFLLSGESVKNFTMTNNENEIKITLSDDVALEAIKNNKYLILEIQATRERAVPATSTLIIDIPDTQVILPVFERAFYTGTFTKEVGLQFTEKISLQLGFDETVTFKLEGDHAQWFSILQEKNSASLLSNAIYPLPDEVFYANNHLLFTIVAQKPGTVSGQAAISITLLKEAEELSVLQFEYNSYVGRIENGSLKMTDSIRIVDIDISAVDLNLTGEFASHFTLLRESDYILLNLLDISEDILNSNDLIILNLEASKANTISSHTTIILSIIENSVQIVQPVFEQAYYIGEYSKQDGLIFSDTIRLIQGFDDTVYFELVGDDSKWFILKKEEQNSLTLLVNDDDGLREITDRSHLVFSVIANKSDSEIGRTAVIISLKDLMVMKELTFAEDFYAGYIDNGTIALKTITINQGDTSDVNFILIGDHFTYFQISRVNTSITIQLVDEIPTEIIESNNILVLTLEANMGNSRAHTTIIFEIIKESNLSIMLDFEHTYYVGSYSKTSEFVFDSKITLINGFDESVHFSLQGENSIWFSIKQDGNSIALLQSEPIPITIIANIRNLVFTIVAQKATNLSATATIIIEILTDDINLTILEFERRNYIGSLNNKALQLEPITLTEGFSENVTFAINKEFITYFGVLQEKATITIELNEPVPEDMIPANEIIVLDLMASAPYSVPASTTIILDAKSNATSSVVKLNFDKNYYTGHYNIPDILNFTEMITLDAGYDESTKIELEGDLSQWFELQITENTAVLKLKTPVPDSILSEFHPLIFLVVAQKDSSDMVARAVIIITHNFGSDVDTSVSFDQVLYNGKLKGGALSHETIRLSGFTGSNINISGELATSFESNVEDDYVTVKVATSASFPENLTFTALTLHAGNARAVLILDVSPPDSELPEVSFSSSSYFFWAGINQTGLIGRVSATVNNGEAVTFTVDADLQDRISINLNGELLLLTTFDKGVYNFQVTATAQISLVSATVPVLLRVDALPECRTEEGHPPLIILQRVEEEPHLNLVILNQTDSEDCTYTITSLWPEDQSWLYIENGGLHAKAIDREHKSIAFMILSQIQVELILQCDNDYQRTIVKRSLTTETGSELDPYNYGSNKWVLADTIPYNARRSVINLIIEDINDNAPIFVGKENEPIYVGYPIPELENTILPRALIELKATDADIGDNAALMYWSMEEHLAVAPSTGYVHVRNNALLENNSRLTVYATDQNGRGLNGSLDIVVKLLEKNQIAVMTVQNAFLDDENTILSNLSTSVGYDIKILRTVVVSDNNESSEATSRRKREIANSSGASLQLFVYGIFGSQLIDVNKLTSDLDQVVSVNALRVESLEDHLEGLAICPILGQHTALLASTIALAVVLFILIIAATAWFILKWRKKRNYEKFSDANSLASRIETEAIPKVESPIKPRLDIEELKRSEKRLQERLDAPIPEIAVHPPKHETTRVAELGSATAKPEETLIDIKDPIMDKQPIVIQSIDKLKDITDESEDDEFGEVEIITPRKSVVTFNENVEKIIHLEYGIDDSSEPDTEVYRF